MPPDLSLARRGQRPLRRTAASRDLQPMRKGPGQRLHPRPRELHPMQQKREFRGRSQPLLHPVLFPCRHQGQNPLHRRREPLPRRALVWQVHQARPQVALVCGIPSFKLLGRLVQLQ